MIIKKDILLHEDLIVVDELQVGKVEKVNIDILSPSSVIVSLNILGVVDDFHLLLVDDKDKDKIVLLYLSLLRVLHEKLDVKVKVAKSNLTKMKYIVGVEI
ncbi:Cro/Cl family transcriptional regulator [Photorhabdus luminescens]|uniref:Cro/Cl family transcriptional regulator n=1 Tax=Photorhabdus luminescens TaxID=29488 RepID=UPI000B4CD01B|nr:Cro/Cl family transcriptional regulator [Photorhabdus luminescens]MCW7761358.1 Cro/Cl family transcriptional regulator [Photorhabdus luminescens subsp. venezuelensis]OWO79572.1 Cro/Cl family transcriptional regulator [Photorhabdus luminescens]